jgi:hypothetical protein
MKGLGAAALLLMVFAVGGCAGGFEGSKQTTTGQGSHLTISAPASVTVVAGQKATFSVTAVGTGPMTYQWYENGTAIPGATSSSYTTAATVANDNGAVFTVSVSSPDGSATSAPATLTVQTPPVIVTPPANQTVPLGQTATFSVTASGTGPLTYQWYRNGAAISGATSSTYTTAATVVGDNGATFTVTVTGPAGNATSSAATLTVQIPVGMAKSLVPSNATPPYNSAVMLVPTFSGGTAVVGSTGPGSSDITSAAVSGTAYPTPALTTSKTYTLTVTDAKGNTTTTTCVVTPTNVTITPITPANLTIAPGTQVFAATASGGVTNTLTWGGGAGTFAGSTWTSPSAPGTYTITATSVDEPSVSVSTTITVSAPTILTQPVGQQVCLGSGIALTVNAAYAASYQWNLNGTAIPGATSATYTVATAAPANSGNYTVTVGSAAGSVTSNIANVNVVTSSITSNPASLSLRPTQTGLFSVSGQGLGALSYQWYQIPSGGTTGVAIGGATSSTYVTPAVDLSYDGAEYYAQVTDSCGTLTSADATLTVTAGNVPPTIITQPVGVTVPVGGTSASFTVVASGTPTLTYQWYLIPAGHTAGTAIPGATAATYNVPSSATATTDDQDQYYVIVSNGFGQVMSQPAPLAVGNGILLQITGQPQTQYVDVGDNATYQVTAVSSLPLTYQWYEAAPGSSTFNAIAGATSSTYTFDSAATTDNGSVFYVVVSNGVTANVTSASAGLFVGPLQGVSNFCDPTWVPIGNATAQSGCAVQLSAALNNQHGEVVWPTLISTGDIQLSFTVTLSNPSALPADGFAVVLGDPSLGATPTSLGAAGMGLGAEGIPGVVIAEDTYHNAGDPPVPYVAVGRGETALFEKPWFDVNEAIPAVVSASMPITHTYAVSIIQGQMTMSMDGVQVLSATITVPPVAYLYITASTGGSYEDTVISNVSATVSVPPSN